MEQERDRETEMLGDCVLHDRHRNFFEPHALKFQQLYIGEGAVVMIERRESKKRISLIGVKFGGVPPVMTVEKTD